MKSCLLISTCLLTMSAYALEYRASYDMIWNIGLALEAEATETLIRKGNLYQMELDAKASIGSATEIADALYDEKLGWKPLEYTYTQSVLGNVKSRHFRFNWNSTGLIRLHEPERAEEKITEDLLDPLSFRLNLAHKLRNNQSIPNAFLMLDGNKIKKFALKRVGEEAIQTAFGVFNTIKFSLEDQNKNTNKYFRFWLAPELNFQLIKLEKKDKKRFFSLILKSHEFFGNP